MNSASKPTSSPADLSELTWLAEVDALHDRLQRWGDTPTAWEPLRTTRGFLTGVLTRAERMRERIELPLVVATFGGTGTGKSSLVNAIVGSEVSRSGRQRPTTTRPVLLAHPEVDLAPLELPLHELELHRELSELLKQFVLIDCPDPDTSDVPEDGPGSVAQTNLSRLRSLLPHCDVLIYTSTQQKYRSAKVLDELTEAATGCRLLFVQTHADRDSDIREDWKQQLSEKFEVPEVFLVDSQEALKRQQAGDDPVGDFARLLGALDRQLATGQRVLIRQGNLVDLLAETLDTAASRLEPYRKPLAELQTALTEQEATSSAAMTEQLRSELGLSRALWERRLLGRVLELWGASPFSLMLRAYHGLGSLIASLTFFRARNSVQMALVGVMEGARWLRSHTQESLSDERLDRISRFGLDDRLLRESRIVMSGYAQQAAFDPDVVRPENLDRLRDQAARVEGEFLEDAGTKIDRLIDEQARKHTRWWTRWRYELLFLTYLLFILLRVGQNFFYGSFLKQYFESDTAPEELLKMEFYVPAVLFFVVWTGLLILLYTRRLRRGLGGKIDELATSLASRHLSRGLFPELSREREIAVRADAELQAMAEQAKQLRTQMTNRSDLGRMS